jgi:type IV fimbrial biogenesis protein FimT
VLNRMQGFSLIELLIGIAVLAVLVGLGIPAFTTMLRNFQIRTAAEAVANGLQVARTEAVRRNTTVRFQLVNTLDSECDLIATGPHWVVSRNDASAKCNQVEVTAFLEPNDNDLPQILMKRVAENGTATIAATAGGVAATTATFNSVGRAAAGGIDAIDIRNDAGGNCEHDMTPGAMRCLRVIISRGGGVKMCDPKVTVATDSRYCQ